MGGAGGVIEREAAGWEKMLRKKAHEQRPEWVPVFPHFTLDDTPDEDSLYAWNRNGDIFDQMLPKLALTGEEQVLELGASTCWATPRFTGLGCDCVAMDITRPKYYGLETAEVWMDAKDIYFERVLCDMHNTPFDLGTFDLVFACAALHHSSDLLKLFAEVRRIIAPGGRFVAIAEPLAPLFGRNKREYIYGRGMAPGPREGRFPRRTVPRQVLGRR